MYNIFKYFSHLKGGGIGNWRLVNGRRFRSLAFSIKSLCRGVQSTEEYRSWIARLLGLEKGPTAPLALRRSTAYNPAARRALGRCDELFSRGGHRRHCSGRLQPAPAAQSLLRVLYLPQEPFEEQRSRAARRVQCDISPLCK